MISDSVMTSVSTNSYLTRRPAVLAAAKFLFLGLAQLPVVRAVPHHLSSILHATADEDTPKDAKDPTLWIYLGVAAALVLLGGAFAGLTIALMGQVRDTLTNHVKKGADHCRMRFISK